MKDITPKLVKLVPGNFKHILICNNFYFENASSCNCLSPSTNISAPGGRVPAAAAPQVRGVSGQDPQTAAVLGLPAHLRQPVQHPPLPLPPLLRLGVLGGVR